MQKNPFSMIRKEEENAQKGQHQKIFCKGGIGGRICVKQNRRTTAEVFRASNENR